MNMLQIISTRILRELLNSGCGLDADKALTFISLSTITVFDYNVLMYVRTFSVNPELFH